MAASKKNIEPLTTDQRREIRAQYVVAGLTEKAIAKAMGLHVTTVRGEVRRASLAAEASLVDRDERVRKIRLAQPEEEAKAQAEVKRLCRAIALTRLNGQLDVARELARLAATKQAPVLSSKGEQGLAAALGSAEADIKGGRLSVGLATDKTEIDEDLTGYAEVLARILRPEAGTDGKHATDDGEGDRADAVPAAECGGEAPRGA